MASSVSSSEYFAAGNVEFEEMGASNIDESLLMSLLEESQLEEPEDERLCNVMRSLEAEIDPNMTNNLAPASAIMPVSAIQGTSEDYRSQDFGLEEGYDCSSGSYVSPSHDFDWLGMDMEMDIASSSTCDYMGNWYMESGADELVVGMVEFGEVRDYSQLYYASPMEEHAYGSLWQETYDSVMYH